MPGMSERVQLLGGKFAVRSQPGAGTSVTAAFPLQLPQVPNIENNGLNQE